jgi:hypothetical protein
MTPGTIRMTNMTANPKSQRPCKRLAAVVIAAIVAMSLASGGCAFPRQAEPKPTLYRVVGRVLDGHTRQPLANVRVRLRAVLPVNFNASSLPVYGDKKPAGAGTIPLTSYGITRTDGKYDIELSEKPEVVRSAIEIRVDASLGGYELGACDLPPPGQPQAAYEAPDIYLLPRSPTGQPAAARPNPAEKPIPWK